MLINWDESYNVNVKEMNEHHQKLISLINDLHEAMRTGKSKEVLAEILNQLVDYTRFHFSAEESWMLKYAYPGYEQQKTEHTLFITKIEGFQQEVKQGKQLVSMKVMDFLKEWLLKHISVVDKKYGPYFNEQGLR